MARSILKLFAVNGRLDRAEWWIQNLTLGGIALIGALLLSIAGDLVRAPGPRDILVTGLAALLALYGIGMAAAQACLAIRRFHDRDKSGWWMGGAYAVALPAAAAERLAGDGTVALAMLAVQAAIILWLVVELGCLKGTAGPNRYGPDPLAATHPSDIDD